MNWPQYFPKNCPPQDSKPATGTFYRIVVDRIGRSLKAKHFWPHKRNQPNKTNWPPGACECQVCGVSILETMEDAMKLAQMLVDKIPANRQSVAQIAQGTLDETMGKIKHTPDTKSGLLSHHDWWLPEGADPVPLFQLYKTATEQL